MIDKTGVGLVKAGMSILAATAHLQMIVIRIRLQFRQESSS